MPLSFGMSFCPNDTFLFYALAHGRTRVGSLDVVMADVEELNQRVIDGSLDVSKVSVGVLPEVRDSYLLLDAGAAFGMLEAPVVVARRVMSPADVKRLAIPGFHTTAFLLYRLFFPVPQRVFAVRYDAVADVVAKGDADAGILIHEGRFVYRRYGLELVADLGELWRERAGDLPVPLGCVVIRRDLAHLKGEFEQAIRESLEYARSHPDEVMPFVKRHAQEMDDLVIKKHIEAFVNKYTLDLGSEGRRAVELLLSSQDKEPHNG